MRYVTPSALLIAALVHALPAFGTTGSEALLALYGVPVDDPNLQILMRHRAALFGLLATFLAYSALNPRLHSIALMGGSISITSFLVLAYTVGDFNEALATVIKVDLLALGVLVLAIVARVSSRDEPIR